MSLLKYIISIVVAVITFYVTRPHENIDGTFTPGILMTLAGVPKTTTYKEQTYNKQTGNVLVVLTEAGDKMRMTNGKVFQTGNHPVEAFVPLLHLKQAGYEFTFATPNGKSAVFEEWALPIEDKAVMDIYKASENAFKNPIKLSDVPDDLEGYVAIYIPGGHGMMVDLPTNKDLGKLLRSAHAQSLATVSICHGPAAFLSAQEENKEFIYNGYKFAAFPDIVDKITPFLGYLPGHMEWYFGEKLAALGMEITNVVPAGAVYQHKELLTGDGPDAANELGKMFVDLLSKK